MRLYLAYDATEILESKLMQLAIFARLQHLISAMMMYVNTFLAWRNWRKKKRLTNFYVRYFLTSVWLGVMKDDGPCRAHFFLFNKARHGLWHESTHAAVLKKSSLIFFFLSSHV